MDRTIVELMHESSRTVRRLRQCVGEIEDLVTEGRRQLEVAYAVLHSSRPVVNASQQPDTSEPLQSH